jgi:hypothetical protein
VAYGAYALAVSLFGGLGMVGGLIIGLISLALLTFYYGWLRAATARERLTVMSAQLFDGDLFNGILNVAFFYFPASLAIEILGKNPETVGVAACASLALIILGNPLPEVIYREGTTGIEALVSSFRFVQENWIAWFLPAILLAAPLLLMDLAQMLVILHKSDQFLPMHGVMLAVGIHFGGTILFGIPLAIVMCTWFMFFRAELFTELNTHSSRARKYMAQSGKL